MSPAVRRRRRRRPQRNAFYKEIVDWMTFLTAEDVVHPNVGPIGLAGGAGAGMLYYVGRSLLSTR